MGLLLLTLLPAAAHNGDDHGDAAPKTASGAAPDEVLLPKESQFLFDIRTESVTTAALVTRRTLLGIITAAPGGEGRLTAPQAGRVVMISVSPGQRVRAGQVLAVLDQTLAAPEQLGLATARANARAELRAAEQDAARLNSIRDIAARKDVIAAGLRLRQARANAALATGQTGRLALTAPIGGVVEGFGLAAGQQVQAGQELLRVIDPQKLVVEAQVFADDVAAVSGTAQFAVESLPGEGATGAAVPASRIAISNVVNPTNQARQLLLALTDTPEARAAGTALRVGQRVQVRVQGVPTRPPLGAAPQVVVPTAALTDVNGQPAVFLHTAPEVFTLRFVRVGEGDDQHTVLLGGLTGGERVVSRNTYQLKSVYLNQ